jgi:hypothetical protein
MDSFWSVANALKDAVKQQTAEITASLQNTDWKTEMSALQKELKEDTVEIGQKAKEVTEELGQKTIHAAKNLPQVVDEGRRKAVAQLEHLPTSSAARAKEAAAHLKEAGASLSQMGSRVVANTSEMFDHFSNAIQAEMNAAQDRDLNTSFTSGGGGASSSSRSLNRNESTKFSRFDADVASMQRDSSTYCDEPDDAEDFEAWNATFNLPGAKPDIAKFLSENTFMSELQARIVPVVVDYESFWTRYFYRLHKLEEKHAQLAALASRAQMEEDDLGWGTEDEEEVGVNVEEQNVQDEEDEDVVEPAVAEPEAIKMEAGGASADPELEKAEEDVGEAEIEAITTAINDNKPETNAGEEEEEEKEEVELATATAAEKEATAAAVPVESKKKKKPEDASAAAATTKEDDDDDDEDAFSNFGEDVPEGEDGEWDDDDVADWE